MQKEEWELIACGMAQVYSCEEHNGWQYHWDVTRGNLLAEQECDMDGICLSEQGITLDFISRQYQDLDVEWAMQTDLARPLLFVPMGAEVRLVDGWHRLFHALVDGVDTLPAYFLSQEQADSCLIAKLPPGKGTNWGQR